MEELSLSLLIELYRIEMMSLMAYQDELTNLLIELYRIEIKR